MRGGNSVARAGVAVALHTVRSEYAGTSYNLCRRRAPAPEWTELRAASSPLRSDGLRGMCCTDETHGILALTEVDRLVLRLSATGLLTREVADQLGLSPDEVRLYIGRAMVALGASSKLEAVVRAVERGLIRFPDG